MATKDLKVSAGYQGEWYGVKSIDFNNRRVNLNAGDIVDLDNGDLQLVFIINSKSIIVQEEYEGNEIYSSKHQAP